MATAYGNPRPLRADAERNRALIVAAAQAAFAERGLDVPLRGIAAQAGVGIATLYRRFPARENLIAACFETRFADYVKSGVEARGDIACHSGSTEYMSHVAVTYAGTSGRWKP